MILPTVLGLAAGYLVGAAPLPAALLARVRDPRRASLVVGASDVLRGVVAVILGAALAGLEASFDARLAVAAGTLGASVAGRAWPFYRSAVAGNGAATLAAGYALLFPPGALYSGLLGLGVLGIFRRWTPAVAAAVISIPLVHLLIHARVGALILVQPVVIGALAGAAAVVILKLWPRIVATIRGQERHLF